MLKIDPEYLEQVRERMYAAKYTRQYSEDVLYNGIKRGMTKSVHDNQKMLDILDELYHRQVIKKGSFVDLVLRIILFHQAFYGLPHIPPFSELTIGIWLMFFSKANFKIKFWSIFIKTSIFWWKLWWKMIQCRIWWCLHRTEWQTFGNIFKCLKIHLKICTKCMISGFKNTNKVD